MDNKFQSHNSTDITSGKQLVVPSAGRVLLYIISSSLLLLALNIGRIWGYLTENVFGDQGGLELYIADHAPALSGIFNFLTHSVILQIIFWALVGCVIYGFIWLAKNIFISLLNDFVADHYVHPAGYNRSKYWESVLMRKIVFTISFILLIILTGIGFSFILALAKTCYDAAINFEVVSSLLTFAGAVMLVSMILYALTIMAYFTGKSWKLIYKDL